MSEISIVNTYNSFSGHDPSIIFFCLACVELVWNACRLVLICISIRYYKEIIKEVRRNVTIRLSDFVDTVSDAVESQDFRDEMLTEYPGHGHKENVTWYCLSAALFVATMLLDLMAVIASNFKTLLLLWIISYPSSTIVEIVTNGCLLKKYTNERYLKRKWGHVVVTFSVTIIFRLYLMWIGYILLAS